MLVSAKRLVEKALHQSDWLRRSCPNYFTCSCVRWVECSTLLYLSRWTKVRNCCCWIVSEIGVVKWPLWMPKRGIWPRRFSLL